MDKAADLQREYLELKALHKRESRQAMVYFYLFFGAVFGAIATEGRLSDGLTFGAAALALAGIVAELSAHRRAVAMDVAAMLRTVAAKE